MLAKSPSCSGCPLETLGKGFSTPEGICSNGVLLVGESLGYQEMLAGLPFRPDAQAGSALQRAINMTSQTRSQFGFWNMVGCHPPGDQLGNTSWEYSAINHCKVHFDKVIEKYRPKVLLALGAIPFKHLVGMEMSIQQVRGYVFRSSRYPDCLVLPTLHPSFVRRGNMKYLQLLLRDIHKAMLLAQGKLKEGEDYLLDPFDANVPIDGIGGKLNYSTNPTVDEATAFSAGVEAYPDLLIAYDIETEKSIGESEDELEEYGSKITQIQFSLSRDSGIALPFTEPFLGIIKDILASPNPKCGHNIWRFDNPILRRAGFPVKGRLDDTMWMFHHLKADLPLGLQQVAQYYGFKFPWKHYAYGHLEFYGIADVDSVQLIMSKLPNELKQRGLYGEYNQREGIYKGYEGLVYSLNPILEQTSARGIPINRTKQEEFSREIDEEKSKIEKELEPLIPKKLLKIHPPNGYVRIPKEVVKVIDDKYNPIEGEAWRLGYERDEEYVKPLTGYSLRTFKVPPPKNIIVEKTRAVGVSELSFTQQMEIMEQEKNELIEVERWCKVLSFNPNSADQISNYIKHIGDEAKAKKAMTKLSKEKAVDSENGGKKKKDNLKTSAEVLKRLYQETGNQVYKFILDYKGLTKMQGTYCGGEYIPGEDGRLHSEFLFRPATLQLSSRKPNCFSSDTEILTEHGWIYLRKVCRDRVYKVAQFDIESGEITFAYPNKYVQQKFKGDLLHYAGLHYDLLLTPDHRCLVQRRRSKARVFVPASGIKLGGACYQLGAGIYKGGTIQLRQSQVVLKVALQADGCSNLYRGKGLEWGFKKSRKILRLEQALKSEGIAYTKRIRDNGVTAFYVRKNDVPDWLSSKHFTSEVLSYSQDTLKMFTFELTQWDGSRGRCFGMNKSDMDIAQIAHILSNKRASLYTDHTRDYHIVHSNGGQGSYIHQRPDAVSYDGYVYCVTMPKGTVIVRRNGKAAITGNCQNTPQHSKLAAKFLRCFEALEGYTFIKADMKSFHATMVGWLAEDEDYLRLCRLDIHSYVTAHMAKLEEASTCLNWTDDDLGGFLKVVKKKYGELRNQAKKVILGIPYGLSENGCYERFRDDFNPTAEEANKGKRKLLTGEALQKEVIRQGKKRVKDLYELLRKLFPKVFIWQSRVKNEAHKQGYLQSPFGARREFACVLDFKYTAGGKEILEQKNGEDAEKAASFYPQVNSFGHMREGMLILENEGLLEKYGLINTVHDDLRFMCKEELVEEALSEIKGVLERRSKVLVSEKMGAFYCEAEFKVGKNLAEFHEVDNPQGLKEIKI